MMRSTMEYHLPMELKSYILSRLPVESLLRFRCVSKTWCSMIDDPFLKQLHTDRLHYSSDSGNIASVSFIHLVPGTSNRFYYWSYNGDDHELSRVSYTVNTSFKYPYGGKSILVGSCNGLVLLYMCFDDHDVPQFYVLNPITRECLRLPKLTKLDASFNITGFGYSHSTNEYKVVRIYNVSDYSIPQVEVYTLGSSKWRKIHNIVRGEVLDVLLGFRYQPDDYRGALLNGALHWINLHGEVVQFDLATERFRPFPCLDCMSLFLGQRLLVSNGMLCAEVLVNRRDWGNNYDNERELWVMRNGAWRKVMSLSYILTEGIYQFITLTKNPRKVIFCRRKRSLVSYDTVDKVFTLLEDDDQQPNKLCLQTLPTPHFFSFVSLTRLRNIPTITLAKNT